MYVIKFVSDVRQVFSQVLRFPPPIKLTPMIYIALLKVGFNPITVTLDIISDFTDMSPEELRTAAYEALQAGNIQSYVRFS